VQKEENHFLSFDEFLLARLESCVRTTIQLFLIEKNL